ncbi:hypothetical protein GCM10010275_56230 [Streptomyces litmocidini]|nr:hypothetical protein GCM10010275_56230 [Streptomyces litmocidini]
MTGRCPAAESPPRSRRGPYCGPIPLEDGALFTMPPRAAQDAPRGFGRAHHATRRAGGLFLRIVESGCSDLALVRVTGPLTAAPRPPSRAADLTLTDARSAPRGR